MTLDLSSSPHDWGDAVQEQECWVWSRQCCVHG